MQRNLALLVCAIIVLTMSIIPFLLIRLYSGAMRRGAKGHLLLTLIVALEAIAASFLLSVAELILWHLQEVPLAVPIIGCVLLVVGVGGALWSGRKLAQSA